MFFQIQIPSGQHLKIRVKRSHLISSWVLKINNNIYNITNKIHNKQQKHVFVSSIPNNQLSRIRAKNMSFNHGMSFGDKWQLIYIYIYINKHNHKNHKINDIDVYSPIQILNSQHLIIKSKNESSNSEFEFSK